MRTVRRILVAIKDPNSKSLPAVDKAIQLARALGAQLELFHALATPVYLNFELLDDENIGELQGRRQLDARKRLEIVAARARKHGIKVTTAVAWDYPTHEAIIRRAAQGKADLIVADSHAGRRTAPWLLHLTDWELLRCSPVPVLLVKSRRPYRHPVVLAAVDPTHALSKPSRLDDEILEAGSTIQRALRGTLHAVHAFNPIPIDATNAELIAAVQPESLVAKARVPARAGFERVLRKMALPKSRRHLVGEHPIDAIPEVARDTGAAIVVMGAVSRSGLKRIFIGNTAERILDALTCDVLVVKPPQFVTKVARDRKGVRFITAPMPLPY